MDQFNRCLLVVNPSSTGYRRSVKLRASLEKSFADTALVTVRLTKTELEKPSTLRRELKKLNEHSLLAVIGGDGSANFVISELLRLSDKAPKLATVLPLWGGNACDLAHMANGRRRNSVEQILRRGERVAVRPIEYNLAHGKTKVAGWAMCYLSFGSVALTARAYDRSRFIHMTAKIPIARLISEIGVGTLALAKARRFRADNGRKLYDVLYINGPRIAKLYRTPAKLAAPGFIEIFATHKHPVGAVHAFNMAKVWLKRTKHVKSGSLHPLDPVWMQFDGEVRRVEANTSIDIAMSKQSIYLLATK